MAAALGAQEKQGQVDQEAFVLEINEDGFGPALEIEIIHGDTVEQADDKCGEE